MLGLSHMLSPSVGLVSLLEMTKPKRLTFFGKETEGLSMVVILLSTNPQQQDLHWPPRPLRIRRNRSFVTVSCDKANHYPLCSTGVCCCKATKTRMQATRKYAKCHKTTTKNMKRKEQFLKTMEKTPKIKTKKHQNRFKNKKTTPQKNKKKKNVFEKIIIKKKNTTKKKVKYEKLME